ncbi:MAG: hypothetical protein EZS28_047912, partial [Streblomastix strix]
MLPANSRGLIESNMNCHLGVIDYFSKNFAKSKVIIQMTRPLKVNVFPSADIYNSLAVSPEQADNDISKLNGLITQLLGGVNIYHQLAIVPMLDDLLHPRKIDDPHVFFIVLDIIKPSSYSVAVELIYILPEFILPQKFNIFPSAFIYNSLSGQLSYPANTMIKPRGLAPLLPIDPTNHQLSIKPVLELGSLPNYILLHKLIGYLLIRSPSLNVPLTIGLIYTYPLNEFGNNYYMILYSERNSDQPLVVNISVIFPQKALTFDSYIYELQ